MVFILVEWREFERAESYSLGLNYIQAALEKENVNVQTLILNDKEVDVIVKKILGFNPRVVALKLYTETAGQVAAIARKLKSINDKIIVVIGGHTATLYRSALLLMESSFDVVCNGEGEETCIDLCRCLLSQQSLHNCRGITFRDRDLIFSNLPREQIDLEKSCFPDYKIFGKITGNGTDFVEMAISSTRGCNGNCYFCVVNRVYQANGKKHWRGMSPEKIVREIAAAADFYSPRKIIVKFLDSSIEDPDPKDKGRLLKILELLEQEKPDIAFSFFTRAESWSEKDIPIIRRLKNAGLYKVYLGFDETAKPYSIYAFTDNMILPENIRARRLFKDEKVITAGYLLMFQPFVTPEQLIRVAEFIDKVGMSSYLDVWTEKVILYPDTKLFYLVAEAGLLLGLSEDGFSYNYAYEDGRVDRFQVCIGRIKRGKNYNSIRSAMMKTDSLIEQYNLRDGYENTQELMITYQDSVQMIYESLGGKQKIYFITALEEVLQGKVPDELIEEWDVMLGQVQKELESIWFRTRIALARNGLVIR